MTDKILTEAFDKLKAIEESDDPFCIGAEAETNDSGYTPVEEAVEDEPGRTSYTMETDSGVEYGVHFQADGGVERVFIEEDGIPIASANIGGAGAMNAQIKNPEAVLNGLMEAVIQGLR